MTQSSPPRGVIAFFIMYCDNSKARVTRSLYQEEFVKPGPGSREIGMDDFQNVVRDLVLNQEIFDSMLKPMERPVNAALPPGRSFKCLRGGTFSIHQFVSGTGIRFFLTTEPKYSSSEAQKKLASIYSGPFVDLVSRNNAISLRDLLNVPPQISTTHPALLNAAFTSDNNVVKNLSSSSSAPNNNDGQVSNDNNNNLSILDSATALSAATSASSGGGHNNNNQEGGGGGGGGEGEAVKYLIPVLPANIQNALRTEVNAILRS